jgi:tetratricopeptide (TPR) repeat protein
MKQRKTKLICTIGVALSLIIALPTGVYAYKYNQYKDSFNDAVSQLDNEKYDESISAFNDISGTYFGKKNSEKIVKEIDKAKELKENKKVYDEALTLLTDKKYLEAIDSFKKIPMEATKIYELASKKIDESKSLYISSNIENAKNEANTSNYDSALNYLALALNLDAANKDASTLKDEYIKAKEAAELKAKQDAEAKAKQEAEVKAKQEAEAKANKAAAEKPKKDTVVNIGKIPPILQPRSSYVPTQVSGQDAIKNEFKKMGFVFQSDTLASYTKDGRYVSLEYVQDGGEKGSCWAVYTSEYFYGNIEEQLVANAMTVILGREKSSYNLTYVHYALGSGQSFETPNIKSRIYDQKLYVFIYLPK